MDPWLKQLINESKQEDAIVLNGDYPDLVIDISLDSLFLLLGNRRFMLVYTTGEQRQHSRPLAGSETLPSLLQLHLFEKGESNLKVIAQVFGVTKKDAESFAERLKLEECPAEGWRVWMKK